jgi:hypothetical protein
MIMTWISTRFMTTSILNCSKCPLLMKRCHRMIPPSMYVVILKIQIKRITKGSKDLNQIIRTTKTMEYYLANSRKRGTPIESPQSHMHRRNKLLVKIRMKIRICHKITQNCMTRFSLRSAIKGLDQHLPQPLSSKGVHHAVHVMFHLIRLDNLSSRLPKLGRVPT